MSKETYELEITYYGPVPGYSNKPLALEVIKLTEEQAKKYKESEEGQYEVLDEVYSPPEWEKFTPYTADYDHELITIEE
jgi:predicted AAA+ superfamily ATPase